MSRSRMFGGDDPEAPASPSPRTTIVGGRPPEDARAAPPVPTGIQRLLRLAALDDAFLERLRESRDGVAGLAGVELSDSERAILRAIPADQIEAIARSLPPPEPPRREFLRQTAATAVVLLGGAALAACEACPGPATMGVRPDLPLPGPVPAQPPPAPLVPGPVVPPPPSPDAGAVPAEPIPEPPPVRPQQSPTPIGGAAPDVPPPEPPPVRPQQSPTPIGGAAPDMPLEPAPTRPDRPGATRGHRRDMPPERQ